MRLYNTLTRTDDELVPRDPGTVGLYVCGPTVQAPPHIGHARPAVLSDVFRRYLEWRGIKVFHVRNITDIEDRIIDKANTEGRPAAAVAEEYSRIYEQEVGRLGVLPPHVVPRATGHLLEMIEMIEQLIEKDFAYQVEGDVLFRVRRFPEYGKLSGRNIDELQAGGRIEPDDRKEDPLDFALWKAAKPGEPSWPSPWGRGRPGWHIECSAMAGKYLGEGFDVHAGGIDLVFPHHENEIAQSEAATGAPFARYWLHSGLLNLEGQKMSKSVGNIISLKEALDRFGANAVRLFYLAVHWRSPAEFSEARLDEAAASFERWNTFERATRRLPDGGKTGAAELVATARGDFVDAMEDNLSTPQAQAVLFNLVARGNAALEEQDFALARAVREEFLELAGVLGYTFADEGHGAELVAPLVDALLALRQEARERKDFATGDAIRDRLAGLGIVVEDAADGARWHLGGKSPA